MKYLKIEALIEIDENLYPGESKDDLKFFIDALNSKEDTSLQIWNNDIGDEICSTEDFKWTILTELKNK